MFQPVKSLTITSLLNWELFRSPCWKNWIISGNKMFWKNFGVTPLNSEKKRKKTETGTHYLTRSSWKNKTNANKKYIYKKVEFSKWALVAVNVSPRLSNAERKLKLLNVCKVQVLNRRTWFILTATETIWTNEWRNEWAGLNLEAAVFMCVVDSYRGLCNNRVWFTFWMFR